MRATSKLLALALTAALQPAIAGVVPLTFEDIKATNDNDGYVELKDRYIKDGIVFSGAAVGLVRRSTACDGEASFVPRVDGCVALALDGGNSFTLKFSKGFIAGTSLYYSALADAGVTITLFKDENATEEITRVGGLTEANCAGSARFCNWDLLTLSFSGVAHSLVVNGLDQTLMLDDFSFVPAASTPGQLPEPASLVLAISALGALGWARKRAAR